MNTPKSCLLLFTLLVNLVASPLAIALEGGLTTTSNKWSGALVPPMELPSADERAAELAQRKKDIEAQKKALQERLARVPSDAMMANLRARMEAIKAEGGWVPELQRVFAFRDLQNMIDNDGVLDPGLLAGYKQFQADLKKRGIDLIVMPFPANSHIYAHRLVDGLDADDEYYPGYTKMLLTLLENDIEVVDFMDAFRKAAQGDIDVNFPNDPHTGSIGRKLAAQALAKRLQRYDFARERADWEPEYTTVEWTGARSDWGLHILNARQLNGPVKQKLETEVRAILKKRPMKRVQIVWPNARPDHRNPAFHYGTPEPEKYGFQDLVLVGDSQLHSAVFGDGLPDFIFAEVGGVCRWGSKSWSGFSLPEIYLETVPNTAIAQPRVVVVSHLFFKLPASDKSDYGPKPLPELGDERPDDLTKQAFNAKVRVLNFSKPKDPNSVDYKEALMLAEAEIVEGPLAGQKIGIRHEVMHNGRLAKSFEKGGRPSGILGEVVNMRLVPWNLAVKEDPELGTTMVYDDINLDLMAPIFWVEDGPLDRKAMRSR